MGLGRLPAGAALISAALAWPGTKAPPARCLRHTAPPAPRGAQRRFPPFKAVGRSVGRPLARQPADQHGGRSRPDNAAIPARGPAASARALAGRPTQASPERLINPAPLGSSATAEASADRGLQEVCGEDAWPMHGPGDAGAVVAGRTTHGPVGASTAARQAAQLTNVVRHNT